MKFIRTAAFLAAFLLSAHAHADCTGPAGTEGKVIYNADHNVLQYCDDTDWIAFPKAPGETSWTAAVQEKIVAADHASMDFFGTVAISGDTALVGAFRDDDVGSSSGSVYVFTRSGGVWSQTGKLNAADGATDDYFGRSVGISGDTAVIGAYGNDDNGAESGSAYIFTRSGGVWSQTAKLIASDAAGSDYFGSSVAISGDTAVIGAQGNDDGGSASGSAYIFTRSGGVWSQTVKLTAADAAAGDQFGGTTFGGGVAISGDTVVIGARFNDDGGSDSGSAYIFTRSGGVWSQTIKLIAADDAAGDLFGISVAISGDTAVIGAEADDDGGSDSGSAYIFTRSGGVWSQTAKLIAADDAAGDNFGNNVAIDGDTAVIGAYNDDGGSADSGSAYIFTRTAGIWGQTTKLTAADAAVTDQFANSVAISGHNALIGAYLNDDGGTSSGSAYFFTPGVAAGVPYNWDQTATESKVTAADAAASDNFGYSAAISGDTAVIGSVYDDDAGSNSGSAYIFTRSGGVWSQSAKLVAADAAAGDTFGVSVDISGNTVIIGARLDDDGGGDSGSAYIFTRSSGVWSQSAKLVASDDAANDQFGISVAISGDTAVVGAYADDDGGADSGSAYIFTRSGGVWSQSAKLIAADDAAGDRFGVRVAISGDTALIGADYDDDGGSNSGSAYVFTRSGGVWNQSAKLIATDDAAGDNFGRSVAIAGDIAVIGAPLDDDGGADSGSAYVFTRSGGVWSQSAKLVAADDAAGDNFGRSTAISGDTAVISAHLDDDGGADSGSAYIFTRVGGAWSQSAKLVASDDAAGDNFGFMVAISGDKAIIGAYGDDDGSGDSGSVYFFGSPWNCTNPTREPGTIIYNDDDRVLQWCGGDTWYGAGPNNPTTPETGCNAPTGVGGDTIYNADYNTLQYCDGGSWIAIGK